MHVARVRVCVSASDGSAGHKRRIGQESLLLLFINIIYDVWSEWIFAEIFLRAANMSICFYLNWYSKRIYALCSW